MTFSGRSRAVVCSAVCVAECVVVWCLPFSGQSLAVVCVLRLVVRSCVATSLLHRVMAPSVAVCVTVCMAVRVAVCVTVCMAVRVAVWCCACLCA